MQKIKIGDRVSVDSFLYSGEGTVVFIDEANLFNAHYLPIQVELDEADSDGHKMKRFNLKQVKLKEE